MDLKAFLGDKTRPRELYWAVCLESGWIQAGIWEIIGEKAEVISLSPPTAWEENDLVGAADAALSAAVQALPEETKEPSKTVFSVPASWVSEGEIKPEYLEQIKKICTELSLEPSGFVVLPEGLAHLIKSEEEAPLNAVVIGISETLVDVCVFNLGNLAGSASVARSVSISDDVIEGLSRFSGAANLPSRFVLYDGKEGQLEDARQMLLGVDWSANSKIKFLHPPKIEIISPEKKILATALAGAAEMGNVTSVEAARPKYVVEEKAEATEKEQEAGDTGFLVGQDVSNVGPGLEVQSSGPVPKPPSIFGNLAGFLTKFAGGILPKTNLIKESGSQKVFLMGAIGFLFFVILGFAYWWFSPRATVRIFVSPKNLNERETITIDTRAGSPDLAGKILPGEITSTEISGEKSRSATGTKLVGDRSRGSVEITNVSGAAVILPAGTVLVASNDLRFTTNSQASISANLLATSPTKGTVDVTASDIGAQYNLVKGEIFKIGNYPKAEVVGTSVADFSGGSSREISAVSSDDHESLEVELTNELTEKAYEDLSGKLPDDRILIKESLVLTALAKTFSAKVGDEASSLKLSLTDKVVGLVVSKKALFDLTGEIVKGKIPPGFMLRENQITTIFVPESADTDTYEFDTTFDVNLLPEVKSEVIAKKISGKRIVLAESYLSTIPGYQRAEIKVVPKFPERIRVLPLMVKNIEIEIEAEQ